MSAKLGGNKIDYMKFASGVFCTSFQFNSLFREIQAVSRFLSVFLILGLITREEKMVWVMVIVSTAANPNK